MAAFSLSKITIPRAKPYIEQLKAIVTPPVDLDEVDTKIKEVAQKFFVESQTAFDNLSNCATSNIDEETTHITLTAKLQKQLSKFENFKRDDSISKLLKTVRKFQKTLLQKIREKDMPSFSYNPTETGRHFETFKTSQKVTGHIVELPYPVKETIEKLSNTPLTNRCKAQLLFAFYKKRLSLRRKLNLLERYLDQLKSPPSAKQCARIRKLLNLPHLLNDEEKQKVEEFISSPSPKEEDQSELLTLMRERKKSLSSDLRGIRDGLDRIIPIEKRAPTLFYLKDVILQNEEKLASQLTHFLDRYGAIRALAIFEKGLSPIEVAHRLGKLLEHDVMKKHHYRKPPIDIFKEWYAQFKEVDLPTNSVWKVEELAHAYEELQVAMQQEGAVKHEAAMLSLEFLFILYDPSGSALATCLSGKGRSIVQLCRSYGISHTLHDKWTTILEVAHNWDKNQLQTEFLLKAGAVLKRPSKKYTSLSFSEELLPKMQRGELSPKELNGLATSLFHYSAELFCAVPPQTYYHGNWKESVEARAYIEAAEKLGVFACIQVLKGETSEARAHTFGQFLRIARMLLEKGEVFFSLFIVQNQAKFLKERKNLFQTDSRFKTYQQTSEELDEISRHLKKYQASLLDKGMLIVPNPGPFQSEISNTIENKENHFNALVVADRLVIHQTALNYWLTLQEASLGVTQFIDEIQAQELIDEDTLYDRVQEFNPHVDPGA